MTLRAELVLAAQAELGEGPVWDATSQRLVWVDILAGHVHATSPVGEDEIVWGTDSTIGCVAKEREGRWLVAERDRLTAVTDWSIREELVVLPIDAGVRTNDGKLDPAGRMVFGTMHFDALPGRGQLYSWDGSELRTLIESVTISNGLGWSRDGSTMYYVDTPTQEIGRYEYEPDTGRLGARQVVATIDPRDGHPDGLCMDDEGRLWLALWGGSEVRCYSQDGELLEVVSVDATNVSSCAWGGGSLWITTARTDSPEAAGDGGLFVVEIPR